MNNKIRSNQTLTKNQLQILAKKTDQVDDFKITFLKNKLNSEAKKAHESLCNGSLPLKVSKFKQRNMEDEIKRLEDYYPKK